MVRIGVFSFLTVLFPALIFSAALSAGVPSLETRSAADVSARQAVLRGSVNPNGARTTAWFEYGENGRFDNSAGVQPLGSETKNLSFTFTLAELRPDTTYYFRLAAVNEFGISRSQTLWFRTKAADSPATPRGPRAVTSGATEIGQFTARLYGSVEPKGLETHAWFEYGTSRSLGETEGYKYFSGGNGSYNFSQSVSGLRAGTVYYYRLAAKNSKGVSRGDIRSFTTAYAERSSLKPEARTRSASNVTSNSGMMRGTVNAKGGKTWVWFEYGASRNLGKASGKRTAGGGNTPLGFSERLRALRSDQVYYYRIVAENAEGRTYGDVLSFRTAVQRSSIYRQNDASRPQTMLAFSPFRQLRGGSSDSVPAEDATMLASAEGSLGGRPWSFYAVLIPAVLLLLGLSYMFYRYGRSRSLMNPRA